MRPIFCVDSGLFVNVPGDHVALCAAPKKFHFVSKIRRIFVHDVAETMVFMRIT
jgi:hypothetical protein